MHVKESTKHQDKETNVTAGSVLVGYLSSHIRRALME